MSAAQSGKTAWSVFGDMSPLFPEDTVAPRRKESLATHFTGTAETAADDLPIFPPVSLQDDVSLDEVDTAFGTLGAK